MSSRLDAGRSEDPYVTSIVVGDDRFGLHLVWDAHAHRAFHSVMGTGWNAVDDLGGEYHGSPVGSSSGGGQNDLDFVFVPRTRTPGGTPDRDVARRRQRTPHGHGGTDRHPRPRPAPLPIDDSSPK